MDKSSGLDVPLTDQAASWDAWNLRSARALAHASMPSLRQAQRLQERLRALGRRDLDIVDLGCGNGWICEQLRSFGSVTGLDLSPQSIEQARARLPSVTFHCGDLFQVPLQQQSFDLVVTLEVLAHVADQPAFVDRAAELLRPGGFLFLSTQNRPVLERWSAVQGPMTGTIRQWVDAARLRQLLSRRFTDISIESVHPVGDQGMLRLVNSIKLNTLVGRLVSKRRIERLKERCMLGHTLLAWARRCS